MEGAHVEAFAAVGGDDVGRSKRAAARLEAFRLVARTQRETVPAGVLREALETAETRGWPEVVRVLLYADYVRLLEAEDDQEWPEALGRFRDRCRRDSDSVLLLCAESESAIVALEDPDLAWSPEVERRLAETAAQLLRSEGPALELATALIACSIAYDMRGVGEIAHELIDAASRLMTACEIPVLQPVVACNGALVLLRESLDLRESGDLARYEDKLIRARALFEEMRGQRDLTMTRKELRHLLQFIDALQGRHRSLEDEPEPETATEQDRNTLTALRLAIQALAAADSEQWARCLELASGAADVADPVTDCVHDLALSLASKAAVEIGQGSFDVVERYVRRLVQRRTQRDTRLALAARAMVEIETLKVDRDVHARAAVTDELTGVANRRGYVQEVARIRGRLDATVAVLLVDLDHLKLINDQHGHHAGDVALRTVADVLTSHVRSDDFVARIGGDEFAVVLPETDRGMAAERAERVRAALHDASRASGSDRDADPDDCAGLDLSVSIGVASGKAKAIDKLVDRADRALFVRKRHGGNGVTSELE